MYPSGGRRMTCVTLERAGMKKDIVDIGLGVDNGGGKRKKSTNQMTL